MSEQIQIIETADGSHSLYLPELDETYHSSHGALQESEHVFIRKGLLEAISIFPERPLQILEVGFGTGLNALLTFRRSELFKLDIEYTTLEPFPVSVDMVKRLNYPGFMDNGKYMEETFAFMHAEGWDVPLQVGHHFLLCKRKIKLEDYKAPPEQYHVIFFDAFAPNKQAELWELPLLEKMYNTLKPKGLLVTYCAKGQFKRDLKAAGFDVETLQGPPGKKEMTRGVKQ